MATLTGDRMTLIELAKRSKDGAIVKIAEVLNQVNAILDDAVWVRANGETAHTTTRRLSLPTGSWRKANQGVALEASRTEQVVETIGMLEAYSQVDAALIDLAANKEEARLSEDMAFVEGMSQTLAHALIYGNTAGAPEQINGLATRYDSTSMSNVTSCGASGSDLTSIWIVQWGPDKVHLAYPKYSETAGISFENKGRTTVRDADNNPFEAYLSHFKVYAGLVVRDDRCVHRICNIATTGTSNIFDEDYLINGLRTMPNGAAGAVVYANRTVLAQMDIAAKDKSNVQYGPADAFGRPVITFRGLPVRQVDAILDTESTVS